jgi:hypothetical protein
MSNLKSILGLVFPMVFAACTDGSPVTPLDAAMVDRPRFLASAAQVHPAVTITVNDLTTGQSISQGQTVTAGDQFQVSVTTTGVDCAGQFVVTSLGAPSSPPSVLVQFVPFIIGGAVGNNSVVGGALTANGLNGGRNDWKVSVSCNGAGVNQFAFDRLQFSAE